MNSARLNFTASTRARDRGVARVETNSAKWIGLMRDHANWIARKEGQVSADELRWYADELERTGLAPSHPNAWGAIFRTRNWVECGWVKSRCVSNHARMIRVWRLK